MLLHGRSSTRLAPLLGSQDQLHILPCCQPCPRDVGWEGEVVLYHEGSEHHRVLFILMPEQERVDASATHETENQTVWRKKLN